MTLATLANESALPVGQALPLYAIGLGLLYLCFIVYGRLLRGIRLRGGQVRSDLFGLPDTLLAGLLVVLVVVALVMQWMYSGTPKAGEAMKVVPSVLILSVPVLLAQLVARGFSMPAVFGIKRVGPVRALGSGLGLVVALLPVLAIVTIISIQILGANASEQEPVKAFREVVKSGKNELIWNAIISVGIIAPLLEEVLFRGYLYPVMKRTFGPLTAALVVSLIFGAVHNNALHFSALTVLALAFTLAYEWSGSIFVPISMHMCFNAANLAVMWWQVRQGAGL